MDESKTIREVVLDNSGIVKVLEEKEKLASEYNAMTAEMDSLGRKKRILENKNKKLDDKISPELKQVVSSQKIGEYETYSRAYAREGKLVIEITDLVESLKKEIRDGRNRNPHNG